jgi:ABC-type phosphate transport system substrate-binding protein
VFVAGILYPAGGVSAADAPAIAVIVSKQNPTTEITSAELRKIVLGERKFWKKGVNARVLVPSKDAKERSGVLQSLLHMNEAEYKTYWIKKVFQGEAAAEPDAYATYGIAQEVILQTDGAVAFVYADKVIPTKVKVLKVDQKSVDDPDYPLR